MTNMIKYAVSFVVGGAIGTAATYFAVKAKAAKQANEEIKEIREFYKNENKPKKVEHSDIPKEEPKKEPAKPEVVNNYTKLTRDLGYSKDEEPKGTPGEKPYVISPDQFGELDDYIKVSLTYYSDKVLADGDGEVVDDIEEVVGDALDHFGEYEDDSVFVRNDAKRCDYEILLDEDPFN